MNRNKALQWLVKSISRWPEVSDTDIPKPMFGNWVRNSFTDTFELWGGSNVNQEKITRDDWVQALNFKPFVSVEDAQQSALDMIKSPKHYQIIDGVESITVIAAGLTVSEWRGFCLGNILKYRIRAGKKDALEQDIAKANEYESLFERYKGLCRHD